MNRSLEHANPLGIEPIPKLLVRFSVPAIVGMLVNALYNVVDRIYIGNSPTLGANGIAGITIGFPIMIILMSMGVLFGIGGSTLFSIRLGQKRTEDAEQVLGNALFMLLTGGLLFMIIGQLFLSKILVLFGASETVLPYATSYMRIIFFGSIFQVTNMGMNNFIRADGNPKVAMLSMLLGAGTNIVLDPIFIYALNWGMAGAAFATVLSQCVSTIWVISYFLGNRSRVKLEVKTIHLQASVIKSFTILGLPAFVLQITSSLLNIILNRTLILNGGDLAISAMGIVNSLQTLIFMPVIGINQGVQPLISFNFGAKQYDRVKQAAKLGILSATAVMLIGYLATRFFPTALVGMFNRQPDLLNLGTFALKRWFLLTPLVGYQIIAGNFFQAIGKSRIALTLTLSRQGLILIPSILIFAHFFGLEGILWAAPVSDALSTLLTTFFFVPGLRDLEKKAVTI
ncbi:MAG: MATE family efflux transporter [Sphaerochaeta sp.]|jgi:putative MATE family efflux protein|uniref:MATE family efflux transporter n=1 Tax=Sphaerochaeta sp. TaxID=1972642 RepID=UPI002FC7C59C